MLLLEYSKIINPIIEIFQILNKSTFRVWVKEVNNMIKFIMIQMNAKYSVYIDPHVITAKGAHPKSVIDKETPVDSTKLFKAGPKAPVSKDIIAPIPVNAMAILRPPSIDLEKETLNTNDSRVITINIIAGAPNPMKKLKPVFSASNIYNIPFSFRKCVTGYEFWGLL